MVSVRRLRRPFGVGAIVVAAILGVGWVVGGQTLVGEDSRQATPGVTDQPGPALWDRDGRTADPEGARRLFESHQRFHGVAEPVDCGTHTHQQGEVMSDEVAACFFDAVKAKQPARLEQTVPTTEGDPVTRTYEVLDTGRVEVTSDSTKDRFGSEGIVTMTCTGPMRSFMIIEFESCQDRLTILPRSRS